MLLVSSVALSIMLSNDLIMPALWRMGIFSRHDKRLPLVLKFTRRICILAVMLLGFLFFNFFNDIDQLSVFGLLAFSAVAQFSPAPDWGVYYRRGGSKQGVYAGLIVGFAMWAYTLLLPTILRSLPSQFSEFTREFLLLGPLGINWLRPEALLGFESFAPLTHGVVWGARFKYFVICLGVTYFPLKCGRTNSAESFFYYETKPLPTQNMGNEVSYSHQDVARLKSRRFNHTGKTHYRRISNPTSL